MRDKQIDRQIDIDKPHKYLQSFHKHTKHTEIIKDQTDMKQKLKLTVLTNNKKEQTKTQRN